MRKLPLFLAFLAVLTTAILWSRYFAGVAHVKDYHTMYAVFAFAPAIVLALCLVVLSLRRRWAAWIGGILLLPAGAIWVISILLVLGDFKIH